LAAGAKTKSAKTKSGKCLVLPPRPICQRNITTPQALRTPFRPSVLVGFISDPGQPSPDVGARYLKAGLC
jgi:hypothetical protein